MHKSMFEMLQSLISTDDVQDPILPVLTIKPGDRRKVRFLGRPYHYFLSVGKAIYRTGEPCRIDSMLQTRWTAPHMERKHAAFEGQTYNIYDPADYNSNEIPKNPVVERYRALIIDRDELRPIGSGTTFGVIKQFDFGSALYDDLRQYCDSFGKSFCGGNAHSFMIKSVIFNGPSVREKAYCYDDEDLGTIRDGLLGELVEHYFPQIVLEIQANALYEISALRKAADLHGTYNPERRCSDQVTPYVRTIHRKGVQTPGLVKSGSSAIKFGPAEYFGAIPLRQDIPVLSKEQAAAEWAKIQQVKSTFAEYEALAVKHGFVTKSPSPENSKVSMICCPHHDDLNPSAALSSDGKSYRCYTCGGVGPIENGAPRARSADEIAQKAWESDPAAQLAEARNTHDCLVGHMWNSNIHVDTPEQAAKNAAEMTAKLTEAASAIGAKIEVFTAVQTPKISHPFSKEEVQKSYDFVKAMEANGVTFEDMKYATTCCEYVSPHANMECNGEWIKPKCSAKGQWSIFQHVHTTQEAEEMQPVYCCSDHLARMLKKLDASEKNNYTVRSIER